MKITEMIDELGLDLASGIDITKEVKGCYIGDLLSLAMSKVQAGNAWITIQTNLNVVAVASLTDASCVIVPDGVEIEQSTIDKANVQGIVMLKSEKSAFELACALSQNI